MAWSSIRTATGDARYSYPCRPANTRWPRFFASYAYLYGIWILLYALLGKGFAYAGFPPIYVGEILLLLGLFALCVSNRAVTLGSSGVGLVMTVFVGWQVLCAAPDIDTYGIDVLRDSVIWGYALFAWVTAALVLRLRGFIPRILLYFANFSRIFLIVGPIAWVATLYYADSLPHWPGTSVSIPLVKGGEFCVHLAGILAFVATGLSQMSEWWLVLVLTDSMLGMRVRGGLLAFIVASGLVLIMRPRLGRTAMLISVVVVVMATMAAFEVRILVPGTTREFSLNQLYQSVYSTFVNGEHSELENTKAWRLAWWNKIWDYTVNGPYFWMGKGYGINLAESDGFHGGTREEPLRSPHNSHLTFLARSGVPGFALWIALQASWIFTMIRSYVAAENVRASEWANLFIWVFGYWLAFTISAGFDVFLEGPMAGIPFWTVFGIGWGASILFRSQLHHREVKGI